MPNTLSYGGRGRAGVRRSRRSLRRSNRGALLWQSAWADPYIVLTPGVTGVLTLLGPADVEEMSNPTLVGGFIQVAGYILNTGDLAQPSGGYLIMGARVVPATISTVSEFPDPFNEDDGDWFWYRSFPLISGGSTHPETDGSGSFMVNDQVKSKRRIAEDEEVVMVYTFLDADAAADDAAVRFLVSSRLLIREP